MIFTFKIVKNKQTNLQLIIVLKYIRKKTNIKFIIIFITSTFENITNDLFSKYNHMINKRKIIYKIRV